MKAIINGRIINDKRIYDDCALVFDDKIVGIISEVDIKAEWDVIDANGQYVSPGFIDTHIHGASGSDVMDATNDTLDTISKSILKSGVTSYLPTTMTMSNEKIKKALNVVKSYMDSQSKDRSQVIGVHLEGPFISEVYKGAQNPQYISIPTLDLIEDYLEIIKIITYAPEEDSDLTFTKQILDKTEIKLSIGHSNCSYEQAVTAFDLGVNRITHCFNGMKPMHHRNPGIVGASLTRPFLSEFIADGIHSNIDFLRGFINTRTVDNCCLITDSMRANYLEEGNYDLGGQNVIVDGNSARLEDGTLAGSILKMDDAVKNTAVDPLTIAEAVYMATGVPAKSIGMENTIGYFNKDCDADIIFFNDTFKITRAFIKSKEVALENN